jgi:hypothetical protein
MQTNSFLLKTMFDLMQANERFMKLADDLLRPESLPRGWTAGFDAAKGTW